MKHSWETLKQAVQDHIGSLNWGYRVQLRDNNVKYLNAYAQFVDANTVKVSDLIITVRISAVMLPIPIFIDLMIVYLTIFIW